MSTLTGLSATRRAAAALLALGATAALTVGCSKDDDQGDPAAAGSSEQAGATDASGKPVSGSSGASGTAASGAKGSGAAGASGGSGAPGAPGAAGGAEGGAAGAGERSPDAPKTPLAELLLTDADAPGFSLQVTPSDQAVEQYKASVGAVKVDPAECAGNTSDIDPASAAAAAGRQGQTPLADTIFDRPKLIADQAALVDRCGTVTKTINSGGQDVNSTVTQTRLPGVEAPGGVTDFAAVEQDSAINGNGVTQHVGTVAYMGVVKGIGVQVLGVAMQGKLDDAGKKAVADLFTKQVEKIDKAG